MCSQRFECIDVHGCGVTWCVIGTLKRTVTRSTETVATHSADGDLTTHHG